MKYLFTIFILLASITVVLADIPADETPETQGFDSDTMVQAVGLVTESDSLVWQGSSYMLGDPPLSLPTTMAYWDVYPGNVGFAHGKDPWGRDFSVLVTNVLPLTPGDIFVGRDELFGIIIPKVAGEVQYVTSYNEDTMADSGDTSYTKSLTIDTRNKVANQENFKAEKLMDFLGSETGSVDSDESLLLDTAGQIGYAGDESICPFPAEKSDYIPQFCNIEEMGSTLNMRQMSLSTSASDRFVAATADTPIAMDYDIIVNGVGNAPALGDVTAYINVHSMEGRVMTIYSFKMPDTGVNLFDSIRPGFALDNIYNEETTARGAIFHFQKDMSYTSGIRRTT